jgi:fermentation-respiration switch protein FrsA (DUF1100 family)
VTKRSVEFAGDGVKLVGDLYLPDGPGPHPAVVLTGPFSTVKEQVTGTYAEQFAARGMAALAFDHRGWGGSGGRPRCHEDPAAKAADLRTAVGFLTAAPEVDADRIAVVGICLGAVYATSFAAFDPRAKALVLIGGSYNDPVVLRERFGAAGYDGLMAEFAVIAQREFETGEVEYWPAANPDGMPAGMPGPEPWSYYGTARGARPSWENRCTALSVMTELTVTATPALPMLTGTPLLVVHGRGDAAVPVADAERTVAAAGGPAELVLVDADDHVGLYDRPDLVAAAADAAAAWFRRHLG